jgi:hypothetical protein
MSMLRRHTPTPAMAVGLTALFVALSGTAYAVEAQSDGLVTAPIVKNVFFERSRDSVAQDLTKVAGIKLTGKCEPYSTTGTRFQIFARSGEAASAELFATQTENGGSTAVADSNLITLQPGVKTGVALVEATSGNSRRKLFSIMFHRGNQVVNVQIHGLAQTNGSYCRAYGTATAGTG